MVTVGTRDKIVVLGMLTRIPVAGIVALTVPYLIGLERLGYDVYYVEQHGANPSTFMVKGDGSREAAAYLNAVMQWFGFGDKWSFWAGHSDGRWFGMSEQRVQELLDSAVAVLNMHGGTTPLPTHPEPDRMVFVDTDPVGFQVLLDHGDPATEHLMEAHGTFFTWGQNIGNPDCLVPPTPGVEFHHTRMPVLLDLWDLPVPRATRSGPSVAGRSTGTRSSSRASSTRGASTSSGSSTSTCRGTRSNASSSRSPGATRSHVACSRRTAGACVTDCRCRGR